MAQNRLISRVLGTLRRIKRATQFGLSRFVWNGLGGFATTPSSSGVSVDIEQSLQLSSYFRAVNLLANAVGKTQFLVKRGADEDKGHPADALVKHWASHHQLSADLFRRTLVVHALLYGNGYARIVRSKTEPVRLVILNPKYVTPELVNGVLYYRLDSLGQAGTDSRRVSASSIIHIKAFSVDGWVGIDPIRYWASETLGLAIAVQKYASQYYENGGQPRAYLHSEHPLSDEQWNNFQERTAGTLNSDLSNPHRMPLLEQMDIKSTGLDAQATQLLESRKQSMLEIANMLGIPPHKLGLTQSSAYKSLEEENKAFREDAVEPWLSQFEDQYRKLLTEDQQDSESHRVEANRFDLSKTDVKNRFEALAKATGGAAFMTPNDARRTMGEDPHPNGNNLHIPPTNEAKADGKTDTETPPAETDGSRSSFRVSLLYRMQALQHVLDRVAKRLCVEATKRAAKSETWPDYLQQLQQRHGDAVHGMLSPIVHLCVSESGDAQRITDDILTEFRNRMQHCYDTATRDDFAAAVSRSCDSFQASTSTMAIDILHSALT